MLNIILANKNSLENKKVLLSEILDSKAHYLSIRIENLSMRISINEHEYLQVMDILSRSFDACTHDLKKINNKLDAINQLLNEG